MSFVAEIHTIVRDDTTARRCTGNNLADDGTIREGSPVRRHITAARRIAAINSGIFCRAANNSARDAHGVALNVAVSTTVAAVDPPAIYRIVNGAAGDGNRIPQQSLPTRRIAAVDIRRRPAANRCRVAYDLAFTSRITAIGICHHSTGDNNAVPRAIFPAANDACVRRIRNRSTIRIRDRLFRIRCAYFSRTIHDQLIVACRAFLSFDLCAIDGGKT